MDGDLEGREHIGGPIGAASWGGLALARMRACWLRGAALSLRKMPELEPPLQGRIPCPFSDTG